MERNQRNDCEWPVARIHVVAEKTSSFGHMYGWNSVRKFGRLRGTYVELRATQSTCSIAFATLIDIKLCDTNLIHSFLIVPYYLRVCLGTSTKNGLR